MAFKELTIGTFPNTDGTFTNVITEANAQLLHSVELERSLVEFVRRRGDYQICMRQEPATTLENSIAEPPKYALTGHNENSEMIFAT